MHFEAHRTTQANFYTIVTKIRSKTDTFQDCKTLKNRVFSLSFFFVFMKINQTATRTSKIPSCEAFGAPFWVILEALGGSWTPFWAS